MIFLYGKEAARNGKSPIISSFNGYDTQEGIRFKNSDTFEWNEKEVYRLKYEEEEDCEDEYNYDHFISQPPNPEPWISVFRFLSAGCVCFMNIQTLNYGKGRDIIYNSKTSAKDLHEQMMHAAEKMRSSSAISKD